MYARGHPEDYNHWAHITGDTRWKYENVLPYFKKSENFECQDELDAETSTYHAKNGPLTVRYADFNGMGQYFIKAAKELGFPTIDYNANFPEGIVNRIVKILVLSLFGNVKLSHTENIWKKSTPGIEHLLSYHSFHS